MYMAGEISLGRAAELAGMNYFLFEEQLRRQGISAMEPKVTDKAGQAARQRGLLTPEQARQALE